MSATSTLNKSRMLKRRYCCTECHEAFASKEELYVHAEACIMEAFENEVIAAYSGVPCYQHSSSVANDVLADNNSSLQDSADSVGITIKKTDVVEREEFVTLKVGDESIDGDVEAVDCRISMEKDADYRPRLITYSSRNDDISQAQTLEGPDGLKLVVSVEKAEDLDPPPCLSVEQSSPSQNAETEESGSRAVDYWGEEDEQLASEEVAGESLNGSSFNPLSTPKVIGALANANDDPLKRKMECPTCGLILYRHNFSTHYRIHTGELPFVCEFCSKRFRTSSSLKVHVRAHTGEKPYVCPSCGYSTITKRNLDRHIENHHVRTGGSKGPATRKSRYRENMDIEWAEVESHVQSQTDRNFGGNPEELSSYSQEVQHSNAWPSVSSPSSSQEPSVL